MQEGSEKKIRLLIDCAVLGIYPHSLLQDVFNDVNNHTLRLTTDLDWYQLDILQRSVRIECPSYQGPLPVAKLTDRARKMFNDSKFFVKSPIESALRTALGGPLYVVNRLYTKMGHFIGNESKRRERFHHMLQFIFLLLLFLPIIFRSLLSIKSLIIAYN